MARKDTRIRQAEIVGMAMAIIGEMGASGLTTARLAGRLGMTEPNLYRHFRDKSAILCAVVDEIGRLLKEKAASVAGERISPKEKLMRIMANHIAEVELRSGIPRLIFSEEMHVRFPGLRERLLDCIGGYLSIIEDVIEEGMSDGTFRPDIDAKGTARTYLGMVQFAAMRWSLSGLSFSLKGEGMRLCENFCVMLGAGGRP
jgi:AcrR family transcriptional regulator